MEGFFIVASLAAVAGGIAGWLSWGHLLVTIVFCVPIILFILAALMVACRWVTGFTLRSLLQAFICYAVPFEQFIMAPCFFMGVLMTIVVYLVKYRS